MGFVDKFWGDVRRVGLREGIMPPNTVLRTQICIYLIKITCLIDDRLCKLKDIPKRRLKDVSDRLPKVVVLGCVDMEGQCELNIFLGKKNPPTRPTKATKMPTNKCTSQPKNPDAPHQSPRRGPRAPLQCRCLSRPREGPRPSRGTWQAVPPRHRYRPCTVRR